MQKTKLFVKKLRMSVYRRPRIELQRLSFEPYILEVDEFWTYVGNKNNKIWLIYAYHRATGGDYAELIDSLRKTFTGDSRTAGLIEKNARLYAENALSQFAGQGNKIIADRLNAEWFRYIGRNRTTTREFCEHLTKKEWVHKSEIPTLLKGEINGHQCEIYEKTGLPLGMIEGTDKDSFIVYCGGWNCNHKLMPVSEESVPKQILNKHSQKTVEKWASENIKYQDIKSKNLYSGYVEISKSSIKNAANHLTGKNKETVIMAIENLNRWKGYKRNVPLKHDREDFTSFNYYTLNIDDKKYIIQVGVLKKSGKERFYTVFDMKKT